MMRLLIAGVWASLVALGSAYAVITLQQGAESVSADGKPQRELEQIKTKTLSVPVIAEGKVQGYVVAEFLFTVDRGAASGLPEPLESFLSDGAFRSLYAGEKLNFGSLKKQDLDALGRTIAETVNARVNAPLVDSVLIQNLSYVSKDEIRGGRG